MRAKLDQYPTPVENGIQILRHLRGMGVIEGTPSFFDPSCGAGNLLDASKAVFGDCVTAGIEIDEELAKQASTAGHRVVCADALATSWTPLAGTNWSVFAGPETVVLMNPPYSHAMEFVRRSVEAGYRTVALMRLSFLGSQGRADFHRRYSPAVYIVPKRIKFVGNATDNPASAWCVWTTGVPGTWSIL